MIDTFLQQNFVFNTGEKWQSKFLDLSMYAKDKLLRFKGQSKINKKSQILSDSDLQDCFAQLFVDFKKCIFINPGMYTLKNITNLDT